MATASNILVIDDDREMVDLLHDLAKRRGVQLKRNAGPNLGVAHDTRAEAFFRHFPQTTQELS